MEAADGQLGLGVDALEAHAGAHVDGDDVSLFQAALTGDAVDDGVVDRNARGAGEPVQVEEGGIPAMLGDELKHGVIQLLGGDAGTDEGSPVRPGLGGEPPSLAHQFHLTVRLNDDPFRHITWSEPP